MSRRKTNALVLGACALALYLIHFGWFLLFGPPAWFESVDERAPQMTSVRLDSGFDSYLNEFARPVRAGLAAQGAVAAAGVTGRIVREDRVPGAGPALLQTRDDGADHLYSRQSESEAWRELPLPSDVRVGEARWLRVRDSYGVLAVQRRAWWPLGRNYGRFWRALIEPELRPESGLFLIDPDGVGSRFLFPGQMPFPSPDRHAVAFLRSERHGLHSLHLWREGDRDPRTVVSLWEAEPGSGPSFYWSWSSDSRVIFVRGTARGSKASPAGTPSAVRLLYDVEGDRLVKLVTE